MDFLIMADPVEGRRPETASGCSAAVMEVRREAQEAVKKIREMTAATVAELNLKAEKPKCARGSGKVEKLRIRELPDGENIVSTPVGRFVIYPSCVGDGLQVKHELPRRTDYYGPFNTREEALQCRRYVYRRAMEQLAFNWLGIPYEALNTSNEDGGLNFCRQASVNRPK